MNKKIIIVIAIVLILISIGVISSLITKNGEEHENAIVCEDINKLKGSKKSFVVFVERQGLDPDNNEFILELKTRYKKVNIVNVPRLVVKNKCVQKLAKEAGINKELNDEKQSLLILYKKGKYVGSFFGIYNYDSIEKYLDEKGIIEKPKPIDNVTFEKFKTSIKGDYIIILLTDDYNQLKPITNGSKKYLKDKNIKYNITNRNSKEGQKIFEYIQKNYKIGHEYPLGLHFKNSKLIAQSPLWEEKYEYDALFK